MRKIIQILSILLLLLYLGCKKETVLNTDQEKKEEIDTLFITDSTKWVRRDQIDIPWPSLANSPWPMFLHDPQHTGRSKFVGPKEGKISWKLVLPDVSWSSPIVDDDGNIYIGCDDNNFYSISKDGYIRWKLQVNGAALSPLLDKKGNIYFPVSGYTKNTTALYAINKNGDIIWKKNFYNGRFLILSAPNISNNGEVIYITLHDSAFFAIRTLNGEILWEYKPVDRRLIGYGPAIFTNNSIYLSLLGRIVTLNQEGRELWKFDIQNPSEIISSISIDNEGNLYFADLHFIYSLNNNGVLRWVNNIDYLFSNSLNKLTVSIGYDGTLYVRGFYPEKIVGQVIFAFDYNGNLKWKNSSIPWYGNESGQAIDYDNNVFLSTELNFLNITPNFYAFDKYGKLKFKMSLFEAEENHVGIDVPPIIVDNNMMYVVNQNYKYSTIYSIK